MEEYIHTFTNATESIANLGVAVNDAASSFSKFIHGVALSRNEAAPAIEVIDNRSAYEERIIQQVLARFAQVPIVKHTCHGCGATVELDADKHLFICRYCGSTYAIGTAQINS